MSAPHPRSTKAESWSLEVRHSRPQNLPRDSNVLQNVGTLGTQTVRGQKAAQKTGARKTVMRRRRLSNLRISAEIQKKKEQICDISGCFDDDEEGNPPVPVVCSCVCF